MTRLVVQLRIYQVLKFKFFLDDKRVYQNSVNKWAGDDDQKCPIRLTLSKNLKRV